MDKTETQAASGIRHGTKTNKTKTTTQKARNMSNNGPHKNIAVNPCAHEVYGVSASLETPTVLLR